MAPADSHRSLAHALARSRARGIPLIAAHRGTAAGLIRPNTLAACRAAFASGADIVEIDTVRSRDGEYFVFHDGYERPLLTSDRELTELTAAEIRRLRYAGLRERDCGGVETAREVVTELPGALLNIDRAYRYFGTGFLDALADWAGPHTDRMLLKTPARAEYLAAAAADPRRFPVFAIVSTPDEVRAVAAHPEVNLVGYEILAETPESPLLAPDFIADARERGLAVFLNALNLEHNRPLLAGFDDRTSLTRGPDAGWGRLCELGADIIQTDWPWLLRAYLASRGRERADAVV